MSVCLSVVYPDVFRTGRRCSGVGGTAAVAPPPFRPVNVNPALCGSCPLVTPYYCRQGNLLCFVFIVCLLYFSVNCVFCVFLQYFRAVGWVIRPVKTVGRWGPYNLCVGGDVKPRQFSRLIVVVVVCHCSLIYIRQRAPLLVTLQQFVARVESRGDSLLIYKT